MERGFIVFSDDWGRHPSSCQHIFKRIYRKYPVVWVNTIGMKLPQLSSYDIGRILEKFRTWFFSKRVRRVHKNLVIYNPFMLPFPNLSPIRNLNRYFLVHGLRDIIKKFQIEPILVTTIPIVTDVVDLLPFKKKVYYRVDDFTRWPGLMHRTLENYEEELLKKVDVLIASSRNLIPSGFQGKVYVVEHGVDFDHFSQVDLEELPNRISHISTPIIGYFGLLDERVDYELIVKIAEKEPAWNIVLIGRRMVDLEGLDKFKNIHLIGEVEYTELPFFIKAFSVCFLPYRQDRSTISISPLKLKECLATGKPVVGTEIPALKASRKYLYLGNEVDGIITAIKTALEEDPSKVRSRQEAVKTESWENKAECFLKYIFGGGNGNQD